MLVVLRSALSEFMSGSIQGRDFPGTGRPREDHSFGEIQENPGKFEGHASFEMHIVGIEAKTALLAGVYAFSRCRI